MELLRSRTMIAIRRTVRLPLNRRIWYIINGVLGEIWRARTIGTLGLRLIELSLTDRCQCHCVHCYNGAVTSTSRRNELSTSEVKSIVDDITAMHATEVCFTGGEPLLREDLVDLVHYAHKKGLVSKLNTNGILLSESLILELKKAGLNWCAVSIDSARKSSHDALRRYDGCYEEAINGLKMLVRHRIPAAITTYARKDRIYTGELAEIVNLGHALDISMVRILFPVPIGMLEGQEDQVLTLEEREEVRKLLEHKIVFLESPREETRCTAAVTKLHIMANGDVTPCVFVPLKYGNIQKQSLKEIWKVMSGFNKNCKINGHCPMCDPSFRKWLRDHSSVAPDRCKQSAHGICYG